MIHHVKAIDQHLVRSQASHVYIKYVYKLLIAYFTALSAKRLM